MVRKLIILFLIASMIPACKKEHRSPELPILSTNPVSVRGSTVSGATFKATIVLHSEDDMLVQGFTYGLVSNPDITNNRVVTTNHISAEGFSIELEDLLVPDTTYHVRSFVKTRNHLIYGNQVSFFSNGSEPPVVNSIEPQMAFWGDTIQIVGENFDHTGKNNSIWFNEFEATNKWGANDTIYVIVPDELNSKWSEISVQVYGKTSDKNKTFEIHTPVVSSISKTEGQYPDTVVVSGDYFSEKHLEVVLKDVQCQVLNIDKKRVSFVVPFLGKGDRYLLYFDQLQHKTSVQDEFKYNEQIIFGLPEDGIFYGDPMVITAKNVDFRKIPVGVYVENSPMYSNYYSKYQDSLVFSISNPWYTLQKHNSYRLTVDYGHKELFSGNFFFKNPLFKLLENETVVNGYLKATAKGRGPNGKCYLSGPVTESHYPSVNAWNIPGWHVNYELLPGSYQFYYEDILGKSEEGQFTIKQPVLNSLSQNVYRRLDNLIVVDGTDMPIRILSGNSFLKVKHLGSSRIFDFNGRSYNLGQNEIKPYWLVGKGTFEVFLELRGQTISNSLQFTFDDDFVFVDSISGFTQPRFWNKEIVKRGTQLVCTDGYNSFVIDLASNQFEKINSPGNEVKNLYNYHGDVYAHASYGPLYKLDHSGNDWEKVIENLDGEYIDVVYTDNDAVFLISSSGQVYTFEGTAIKKHGVIQNYQSTAYIHARNDELFFFRQIEVEVYDRNTFTSKEKIGIQIPELRRNEKKFVPTKHGLAIYHNRTMALFDVKNRGLSVPNDDHLPGGNNILYSDENEELFLLNEKFLYTYKPK